MKDVIDEVRKRIEGIERQVGLLPKPWEAKPAVTKPVATKKK